MPDYPQKRAEAARWLALGRSADYAGARAHVSASTVRNWRRTDPVFRSLMEEQEKGLVALGLQVIARGTVPVKVREKARPGLSPTEALRAMALDLGRIEATRAA
ncbi:hypothetical protein [Streptomyces sp. NPDC086182]|uniref:hypothetical protein n=1 Tax=Streptomyces sp. NPDC086182 TaxID=3155058 RepID=UPI003422F223